MSFFEAPPPPPEPPQQLQPEWLGPAENALPAPFPLWAVLARTEEVALYVHSGLAYANGFAFTLSIRRRRERDAGHDLIRHWHVRPGGEIPDEALRFGIRFADGGKATVFDAHRRFATEDRPDGPVLMQRGGSGGMHGWELGFWVWPLPPEGPLTLVAEWPVEALQLTERELDTAPIRAAAARAEQLWPEAGRPAPGGGTTFMRRVG